MLRLSYRVESRADRIWSTVGGAVLLLVGVANLVIGHKGLGAGLAVGGVILLVLVLRIAPFGMLRLDATTLAIGPPDRAQRHELARFVGYSRLKQTSLFADGRETWAVTFAPEAPQPARVILVAMLDPLDIDELERRLDIRRRALAFDDPRALAALEAHHQGGPAAIGAHLATDGWRAFYRLDELHALGDQPYRDNPRIPICVRSDVWDALQSSAPELAARLDPVAVPS